MSFQALFNGEPLTIVIHREERTTGLQADWKGAEAYTQFHFGQETARRQAAGEDLAWLWEYFKVPNDPVPWVEDNGVWTLTVGPLTYTIVDLHKRPELARPTTKGAL